MDVTTVQEKCMFILVIDERHIKTRRFSNDDIIKIYRNSITSISIGFKLV